jgi:hypothetical protein
MNPIITIKDHGSFTQVDLEVAKKLLNKNAHPHLYPVNEGDNQDLPSLKYLDTILMDAEVIQKKGILGHEQPVRSAGINPEYPKLKQDIDETGWRLYGFPISVREVDGEYYLMDGRTKDSILSEKKFKNRIVNVYRCSDSDALIAGLDLNLTNPPAGVAKEIDIIDAAHYAIKHGFLEVDEVAILEWIEKACKHSSISRKKRDQMRWRVFYNYDNKTGILPRAWAKDTEVTAWLKTHNYINNNKVMYLPFAASSPSKALISAAALAQENPGKEIRIVLYVSKLEGYDLKKCYVKAVLEFKESFYSKLSQVSFAYFNGKQPQDFPVKLYGSVPSNIPEICDDMDKMIIFGKNDNCINRAYLTNLALNQFFDVVDEDEE